MQPSPVEVQDKLRRKVRAKMLVDAAGRQVRDPATGMPLLVDEDFDMDRALSFAHLLAASAQGSSRNPLGEPMLS